MANDQIRVSIDLSVDAAYIKIADHPVARTRELTDDVLVDLDSYDVVVGIELLTLNAAIPLSALATECHVPQAALAIIASLEPGLASRFMVAAEGTASTTSDHPLAA